MKKTFKIISIIFIFILTFSICSGCGESLEYSYDIYKEIDTVIIREYKGLKKNVVVPEKIKGVTVRQISDFAFAESTVESVVFPDSVERLGTAVFINCASLKSVSFGSEFFSTGYVTFKNCTSLEALYFSGNAPIIGHKSLQDEADITIYYNKGTTGWKEFKTNYSNFKFIER